MSDAASKDLFSQYKPHSAEEIEKLREEAAWVEKNLAGWEYATDILRLLANLAERDREIAAHKINMMTAEACVEAADKRIAELEHEVVTLRERLAFAESPEVCAVAHDAPYDSCAWCERDEARQRIAELEAERDTYESAATKALAERDELRERIAELEEAEQRWRSQALSLARALGPSEADRPTITAAMPLAEERIADLEAAGRKVMPILNNAEYGRHAAQGEHPQAQDIQAFRKHLEGE